jgi:hypothetical protein
MMTTLLLKCFLHSTRISGEAIGVGVSLPLATANANSYQLLTITVKH